MTTEQAVEKQHTPGPWEVREDGHDEPNRVSICAPWHRAVPVDAPGFGDYRGVTVAELSWPPDEGRSEPVVRANARLIAAAPDLLAQLQMARAQMDNCYRIAKEWAAKNEDASYIAQVLNEEVREADSLIAKVAVGDWPR